jgi:MATE family multidrug resistance protein
MPEAGGPWASPEAIITPPLPTRAGTLREHVRRTLKLAGPIIIARTGMPLIFLVATVMVARTGTLELAYLSLAMAPQLLFLMISVGFMHGVMILVSHAQGAKHYAACGLVWRIGLVHAFVLGSVFSLLSLLTPEFFLATGQDLQLANGSRGSIWGFAWGMPAQIFFMCTAFFLEATGRPNIGVVAIVIGNIVNVFLNIVLIHGFAGFAPLGAAGAAHATSAVRWCMFLVVLGYVVYDARRSHDSYHVFAGWRENLSLVRNFGGPVGQRLRRMGMPIALSMGLEAAALVTMVLIAGILGAVALAAHQVTINSITLVFMIAIGMGGATAVRVGNAVGRHDAEGLVWASWTGVALGGGLMAPWAALFAAAPEWVAHIYLKDPATFAVACETLRVAGYLLVIDAIMVVLLNALRGAGDVIVGMIVHILAYWVIVIPLGWYFAVTKDVGAPGLMWGLFAGVVVASIALGARLHQVGRRGLPPPFIPGSVPDAGSISRP